MFDRDHEHVLNPTQGQASSRPNSVNLPTHLTTRTADRSTRSSKTTQKLEVVREDPVHMASSDPGHTIDNLTTFEVERCSLEMKDTEPVEGEPRGNWTTCILRLLMVEAEDKDPFGCTKLLELFGSRDNSSRKIWQLCECYSRVTAFLIENLTRGPCRASTDVRHG